MAGNKRNEKQRQRIRKRKMWKAPIAASTIDAVPVIRHGTSPLNPTVITRTTDRTFAPDLFHARMHEICDGCLEIHDGYLHVCTRCLQIYKWACIRYAGCQEMEGAIKILKALYARSSNTSPSRCRHWSGVPVNAVRSYDATQRDSALDMYFKDKQEVNEELSKQADDQLHYQQQVSDMDVQSICGLSFVLPPTL